jgi:hypothetical protein
MELQPRAVVMIGMCAGRPDKFQLGDVAVGVAGINISEGKRMGDGTLSRNHGVQANSFARTLGEQCETWEEKAKALCLGDRNVRWCEFQSGPHVDESGSVWKDDLGRFVMAYDMETSAYFTATERYKALKGNLQVLPVVKGVMDFANAASRISGEQKGHYQHVAVVNATRTVMHFILPNYAKHVADGHVPIAAQYLAAKAAEKGSASVAAQLNADLKTLPPTDSQAKLILGNLVMSRQPAPAERLTMAMVHTALVSNVPDEQQIIAVETALEQAQAPSALLGPWRLKQQTGAGGVTVAMAALRPDRQNRT